MTTVDYPNHPTIPEVSVRITPQVNRLTVLFRLVLVIPHQVALLVLAIPLMVILPISWLVALVTGQVPAGLASYLEGYTCWVSRVNAYTYMMVDDYPPFSFSCDSDYPVQISLSPGRIGRLVVLFRILTVTPLAIVTVALAFGWELLAVFFWLYMLITGRRPRMVMGATMVTLYAALRYMAAYMMLDSSPVPMICTKPDDGTDAINDPAPVPSDEQDVYTPPVPLWLQQQRAAAPAPQDDTYVLRSSLGRVPTSRSSLRLTVVFALLGVVGYGGFVALRLSAGTSQTASGNNASIQFAQALQPVATANVSLSHQISACGLTSATSLPCLQAAAEHMDSTYTHFVNTLGTLTWPSPTVAASAHAVSDDFASLAAIYSQMSTAGSINGFDRLAGGIVASQSQVQADMSALVKELGLGTIPA